MNDKNILFIKHKNENLQVDVCAVPDWEGFDKLVGFVEKYYDAEVLMRADGPEGSRRWILKSGDVTFELIHDDMYGNYFTARDLRGEEIITKIGKDLEERLKIFNFISEFCE